jgi:hypothetical protein
MGKAWHVWFSRTPYPSLLTSWRLPVWNGLVRHRLEPWTRPWRRICFTAGPWRARLNSCRTAKRLNAHRKARSAVQSTASLCCGRSRRHGPRSHSRPRAGPARSIDSSSFGDEGSKCLITRDSWTLSQRKRERSSRYPRSFASGLRFQVDAREPLCTHDLAELGQAAPVLVATTSP